MPWNRNRMRPTTGAKVPKEVEQYYESTRKERVGVAWLLAVVTLLITVLIAAFLFFGGRWIYRKITANETNNQPETTQQEGSNTEQAPAETPGSDQSTPTNDTSQSSGNAIGSSSQDSPSQPQKRSTTPTTGPETPEIPRTGPTSNE